MAKGRSKIKFLSDGFQQVMLTDGVSQALVSAAGQVTSNAPGTKVDIEIRTFAGHQRPMAYVATAADDLQGAEFQRESLERSVMGAHFGDTKKNSGKNGRKGGRKKKGS